MSDWRHLAACRYEDPELFFPIGNTGPALLQIEDAKAVCRRCDVVDQCLQWALESGQDAGVAGGMSEDERRSLKRRAARLRAAERQIDEPDAVPRVPHRRSSGVGNARVKDAGGRFVRAVDAPVVVVGDALDGS